jgi:hypothetical protein
MLWWRRRARGVRHALVVLAGLTAMTFVVYAAAALLPRPSARLAVEQCVRHSPAPPSSGARTNPCKV